MGLKLNDPSDPFELSDFIGNWGILDASPGAYICTSTSRPNWGAAQAGRMIFMTDQKQLSYWSGTSWNDLRNAAPMFATGVFLDTACNPGSSGAFNLLTFTTPRGSSLAIWMCATYTYPNNKTQDAAQAITFDGVPQLMGSYQEEIRFAGNSADAGATAATNATSMTMIPSVAAGQHKIGIRVQVGSSYPTSVILLGVKIMALISVYSGSNVL